MTLACGSTAKTQSKSKNLSESYQFKTIDNVDLKVQVDYKSSNYKSYSTICECKYLVTNSGTKDLTKRAIIFFDITTNDGNVMQVKEFIDENILTGYSTTAKSISKYVGEKRYCTDIKPVKITYEP